MKSRLLLPLIGGFVMWFAEGVLLQVKASGEGLSVDCRFPGCVPSVSFLLGESLSVACGPSVVLLESLRVVV